MEELSVLLTKFFPILVNRLKNLFHYRVGHEETARDRALNTGISFLNALVQEYLH